MCMFWLCGMYVLVAIPFANKPDGMPNGDTVWFPAGLDIDGCRDCTESDATDVPGPTSVAPFSGDIEYGGCGVLLCVVLLLLLVWLYGS